MAKSMGASPEALKKMEASMKANKDTSTDASGKPAMAGKTEKPQGMSAMMAAMGKAPKEYSKEEVEFALAVAEVERTIKNVGNYKNALLTSPEEELSSLMNALKGGYTAPTPGGDPIANPNTLPTGRNMYAINAEATPTESAWEKVLLWPSRQLIRTSNVTTTPYHARSVIHYGHPSLLKPEGQPSHRYFIC